MQELNIINENDEIIGTDTRENIHKNGLLHREIHVCIFNDQGEVLLQRRGMNKDTYPGLLDVSVGGHMEIGATYETTAVKEIEEETGLKIEKKNLVFLEKIRRSSFDVKTGMKNNSIRYVYAYRYNGLAEDLKLEAGEATSLEFWPIERLLNLKEEEKKDFVPSIVNGNFSGIFEKIKILLSELTSKNEKSH
jgi:isopentenyl-diphosphate Delta-isomerase